MIEISTRVLRAMIALDDLRHFALAAARCNVTQSALSQMISKLEKSLDLRLIDRDRRRVSLTAEGERFVQTARRVILDLEEISVDLRDHATMHKGRVCIAALPSLASYWLPPVIARFRERYPGIQVSLADTAPDRALEQVRQRQADFALTARGPGMVGFQSKLLFTENFVFACHRSHALATRERLTLDDLAHQHYIRTIRNGSIAQHLEKFFRDVPFNDTGLEVEQLATAANLVACNLGVCLVPAMAIPYFNPTTVATVPLEGTDMARSIFLVWRSASVLSAAAQSFVEMLPPPASPGE